MYLEQKEIYKNPRIQGFFIDILRFDLSKGMQKPSRAETLRSNFYRVTYNI